jgi:hypothetical protein
MAQVFSQNGWPAYATTDHFTRFDAGGRGWWAANSDVAVIFADLIEWFNQDIEPVASADKVFDDWSYANRLVRGSTSVVSNHGSATAIDINATRHPRGVHNTFANSDVKKIRAKVKEYDGVIRWGGDYKTTVDDMHFEINASKAATKRVADRIRERDVFTKSDKEWISAEIKRQAKTAAHEALVDVLTKEQLVPNKPVKEGDPVAAPWTFAGVLSALDLKADVTAQARNAATPK